jgi:hypothetical protein
MRSALSRRFGALVGLTALVAVAFAAAKPPARGVTYRLRMSSQLPQIMAQMSGDGGGPMVLARVKAIGSRARFDFQAFQPAPQNLSLDDYILILDSSRTVFVSPEQKAYGEAPGMLGGGGVLGMLGSMAGGGRRAVGAGGRGAAGGGGGAGGGAATGAAGAQRGVEFTGVVTDIEQLDGDTLDGRTVKHYRIVAEANAGIMGQMLPIRILIEMWTANLPQKIVNPFDVMAQISPNDPGANRLTLKLSELRKQVDGTPVKTVVNMTLSGLAGGTLPPLEFAQTTAITDIKEVDVDEKELAIPAGYTKKGGS